jgi:toxin ParE1/3/4
MAIIRLSHLADSDLDSIRDYISQHSPRAANKILDELFETLELLARQPELGERRDDLDRNIRAFIIRPYVIFYEPSAGGIHVARIIHGARDFPSLFPN